jgi:hypothetical protein
VAGQLVFSTDVIPDLQVDNRHFVVFEKNHLQAIRKRMRRELHLRRENLRLLFLGSEGLGEQRRETRGHSCRENGRE